MKTIEEFVHEKLSKYFYYTASALAMVWYYTESKEGKFTDLRAKIEQAVKDYKWKVSQ
jgi:hypothetical protein